MQKDLEEVILDSLKHGRDSDTKFDPKQLAKGQKVEMEHTTSPRIAKGIARAHLSEIADYYTWLAKMETKAKASKK